MRVIRGAEWPLFRAAGYYPLLLAILAAALICAFATGARAQEDEGPRIAIGVVLPVGGEGDPHLAKLIGSVEKGATMAAEEFIFNATLFGVDFSVAIEQGEDVLAVADQLRDDGIDAIVGGITDTDARALSAWAADQGVPFVNLLASTDTLRNAECARTTFHLAPSAAMYLDALAGWYVGAGLRQWYFLHSDTSEAEAQLARATRAIEGRHFGARVVGSSTVASGADVEAIASDIAGSDADLVVLLLSAEEQLTALAALEAAGLDVMVAGFPHPETQSRDFFVASRAAAPELGSGFRAVAWEPTLDAYGARELNARYLARWNEPMAAGAWAAMVAIKSLYEAMFLGGSSEPEAVIDYLRAESTVFDLWKGIGASFRPWDHQMRQPLYLAKISEDDSEGIQAGLLVGELPAIYMPGTDPIERLDQLGDLASDSTCRALAAG